MRVAAWRRGPAARSNRRGRRSRPRRADPCGPACSSRADPSPRGRRVVFLDQRRLPLEEVEVECRSAAEVADAIRTMVVRGAPAIGIAAAYGYALAAARGEDLDAAGRVLRGLAADRRQPRLGARRDAATTRRPSTRARSTPTRSTAAGGWLRTRPGCSRPAHACADALQRRRARDRRLRQRGRRAARAWERDLARARLGRRDAAAAPGRAPDRVGARDGSASRTR